MSILLELCEEHRSKIHPEARSDDVGRDSMLEFMEALFETPTRAWAWLAWSDSEPIGYVAATVCFSILDRGYVFDVEGLYIRTGGIPHWNPRVVADQLFDQVQQKARLLGCAKLHWRTETWLGVGREYDPSFNAKRQYFSRHELSLV